MSDEEETVSDTEVDDSKHSNLIENVLGLDKVRHIKNPTRSEPTLQISEFNLVKSLSGKKGVVRVNNLAKVLKQRSSHVEIHKKLDRTKKKSKTLPKPLEKPQAERIRRSVGYENAKEELNKWEPVVTSNRAALHVHFPLNTDVTLKEFTAKDKFKWRVKTELQKKIEEIEQQVVEVKTAELQEPDIEFPLTLEEIMERRREAAKMRALQSYKEAKARRQNRIKSKKFHRIQRREKIKNQMKEFELLQKTNPEEALKKLEEIEKVRADERASLRHRSTGKWARNKQVRAKYDKESRQALAQQLSVSRDLTQKLKVDSESESDNEQEELKNIKANSDSNPWVSSIKTNGEVETFVKSYKKFWEEQNINRASEEKETNEMAQKQNTPEIQTETEEDLEEDSIDYKNNVEEFVENKISEAKKRKKNKSENKSKTKRIRKQLVSTTDWIVTDINDETAIDDVFDNIEETLSQKLKQKSAKLVNGDSKKKKKQKTPKQKKKKYKVDLSLPNQKKKPQIDEELDESTNAGADVSHKSADYIVLQQILKDDGKKPKEHMPSEENIDPNKVIEVKTVSLNTELPDMLTTDDNEENPDQLAGISEAFEDDDILDDFKKEKAAEIDKDKPKDIDLNLPGWGNWGGKDLKIPTRKRRRFIIKFPKEMPRRDKNKGKLIIKESLNTKTKEHLVSEVPFPFTAVKDFEASIRAPIGNTFVPEPAFRNMIKPSVTTPMGTVIEPMTDDFLIKKFLKK